MQTFDVIAIIYNPNSTGASEDEAQTLAASLQQAGVTPEATLIATEYAGHATEIAASLVQEHARPLIISSSGDGGYHEVINGVMSAVSTSGSPVCAVLPAGNANDHSNAVQKHELTDAIASGATEKLDLLRIEFTSEGESRVEYAHSYVGIGLTPTVATMLNRERLNRVKEVWLVYRGFRDLQPVHIEHDGRHLAIDSLVIANIRRMAKVLTIAGNAEPDDGLLNVTVFPDRGRLALIASLIKAMVVGIKALPMREYSLRTEKPLAVQFDGKVRTADAGTEMRVAVAPLALESIV